MMKGKGKLAVLLAALVPPSVLLGVLILVSDNPLLPPNCPEGGVTRQEGDLFTRIQPQCLGSLLGSPFATALLVIVGALGAVIAWRRVRRLS